MALWVLPTAKKFFLIYKAPSLIMGYIIFLHSRYIIMLLTLIHSGYFAGLDFAVYTFPVIALAIIGLVYLDLKTREPRSR
jgi:hypothetical protein